MSAIRTAILYGESGSGKTTNLFALARWYHETTGKRIRYITCSGGGVEPFEASGYIEAGIVQMVDIAQLMQGSSIKLALMKRLSEGYWPYETADNKGNCGGGKWYFKAEPSCMSIVEDNIGMYQFEDLRSLGRFLLAHLSEKDQGTGFKHSYAIEEDDYKIGGLQEGHYGIVQNEIFKLMQMGFRTLSLDWFIATSLIGSDGTDKRSPTCYAPSLVGSASTKDVPSWFGDCLLLREEDVLIEYPDGSKAPGKRRMGHFMDYTAENDAIPHKAKIRTASVLMPKISNKFPGGLIELVPSSNTLEDGIMPLIAYRERANAIYRANLQKALKIAQSATSTLS